jgi:PIN domain nuclease of toxin-antitoxin system
MRFLLDTQLAIWIPASSPRLSKSLLRILASRQDEFLFSVVSLWEIAIKRSTGKLDVRLDPRGIRRQMVNAGYQELSINGDHAVHVDTLPPIHKDPFDRLLIAQAMVEGITLLTADETIARYPGPIRKV